MNIAVAVKVVPDDQDIAVAADRTLDYSKAHQVVSEYDLNAIEAAALLADAGVDVSAAVEIASVTAPEQAARKRQVFDMKNDGDFDAFASAVAAAVRA